MIRFNASSGDFVAVGHEWAKLLDEGWDFFDPPDGGPRVYATGEPYKVLEYYDECDEAGQEELWLLKVEHDNSWASAPAPGVGGSLPVPDGRVLYPYQVSGVAYALRRQSTILGDEPGLGKTAQAIVYCNAVRAQRVLVVAPASLRLNWKREIEAWSTLVPVHTYPVIKSEDGVNPHAHYVIVSYDLCRNNAIHDVLMRLDWDVMILDEAHYLKTPEAGRTRKVLGYFSNPEEGLASRSKRILALTGTPLPNRPKECYTLVRALNHDAFEGLSEDGFMMKYNPSMRLGDYNLEKVGHLPELRARLRCNVMVRRLQKDVLKDLPEMRYELLQLENPEIKRIVKEEKAFLAQLGVENLADFDPAKQLTGLPDNREGHIATLRREMSEAIAPEVVKVARILLEGGLNKLLIGFYHRMTGDIIQEGLEKWGTMRIDGRVSVARRQKNVDDFQNSARPAVGLLQTTAAGVGLTLTAAHHMIVVDPDWTPGNNEQLVKRMHRIGQKNAVLAQFAVGLGSWNDHILGRAVEKLQTTTIALDG